MFSTGTSHRCVLIAFNPKSGAGSAGSVIQRLKMAIEERGFAAHIVDSLDQVKSDATRLFSDDRLEVVISAGGDGTVSALANLLPPSIPLMIFPLGTENLLAKYWGNSADVDQACNTLLARRSVHMDVGCANGKLFLVMLSCGFDAEVVHRMHAHRTGPIRHWQYAMPILKTLANYRFPQMNLSQTNSPTIPDRKVPWLFIFNVPRYAANLQFCPEADPTDGKLDVCTFRGSGLFAGLYYLYQLWRGNHEKLTDFTHASMRSLRVDPPLDSAGNPLEIPFQIDGDPGGNLPLDIQVLPGRLRLIVPESTIAMDPLLNLPESVAPSYF